jgi:hypothetical protein
MNFAAIGQTREEVERLYGEPTMAEGCIAGYMVGGLDILVTYSDGKSVAEIYSQQDQSLFSEDEVVAILTANDKKGALWRHADAGSVLVWILAEKNLVITYKPYSSPPMLDIQDSRLENSPRWKTQLG